MTVDSVSIKFDASGLNAALDGMAAGALEHVRPAAQAGAQVLYDEVLVRVPVSSKPRKLKSGRVIEPGGLRAAIYQAYSEDNSDDKRATYHVSWNYRKAPHGHLVEHGTRQSPAHPFLRPAYDAKADDALKAANGKWVEGMQGVVAGAKA